MLGDKAVVLLPQPLLPAQQAHNALRIVQLLWPSKTSSGQAHALTWPISQEEVTVRMLATYLPAGCQVCKRLPGGISCGSPSLKANSPWAFQQVLLILRLMRNLRGLLHDHQLLSKQAPPRGEQRLCLRRLWQQ